MSESSRGDATNYKTTFNSGDRVQPRPHITLDDRPAVEVDGPAVVRRVSVLDTGGELVHVRHDNGTVTSWPADQLELVAPERIPSEDACPGCGRVEVWHGVIVEPGERERFACDECGHSEFVMPLELDSRLSAEQQERDHDYIGAVLEHHRAAATNFGEAEWAALGKRMLAAQLDRDEMSLHLNTSEWVADLAGVPVSSLYRGEES